MKSFARLAFCISAFTLLALTACKKDTPSLQVNDVASDPGAYTEPVTVVGITYGYSQSDPSIIGIMDKSELQCTTPNCNKVLLPVKTEGARPSIGDEVEISGVFTREPGGYLLHAESVKVLTTHKLGGQG